MALQHSTEYSLSTVSDSGPWGAWVQPPEHAAEDCGPHSLTIVGLPVGLYWARLRITSLPLTANSTVAISQTFTFDVVNQAAYLSGTQGAQTADASVGVQYGIAAAGNQKAQASTASAGVSISAAIAETQALQTERILTPSNDQYGDLAGTQAQQSEAVTVAIAYTSALAVSQARQAGAGAAGVTVSGVTAGAQKVQTEAVAVTYTEGTSGGGPVTLDFETADLTDSSGATWTKHVPSAGMGILGVITSGVTGVAGSTGNCLSIMPTIYDPDGTDENSYIDKTTITRTMNIGAGNITMRVKRTTATIAFIVNINGVSTSFSQASLLLNTFTTITVPIASPMSNANIEFGHNSNSAYGLVYVDSVSIPQ